MSTLLLCAREIEKARNAGDEAARVGWRGEIAYVQERAVDEVCASFAQHLVEEDRDARVSVDKIAEEAGYRVHARTRDSWRALFEALVLTSQYAGLTREQTKRRGLGFIGRGTPQAAMVQFDESLEHLGGLIDLLEHGRTRLQLAIEGAAQAA